MTQRLIYPLLTVLLFTCAVSARAQKPSAPIAVATAVEALTAATPAPAAPSTAPAQPATSPAATSATAITEPSPATAKSTASAVHLPVGMCPLDPNQDADRKAIMEMHISAQGEYKLLAVFAECRQLNALRSGSTKVTFLSQYGTLIEQQNATVALNRQSTVLALSSALGLTSAIASEVTQAEQAERKPLGVRSASYHGIVKQTADYIIVGSEQRHIMKKQEYGMAVVSLITVIKGNIVTANFFAPFVDQGSFTTLGTQAEAYYQQISAATPQ